MSACDYAACGRPATHHADGWAFCYGHLREHQALMRPERPRRARTSQTPSAELLAAVAELHALGLDDAAAAERLGVNRHTVARYRRANGLPSNGPGSRSGGGRPARCGTRAGRMRHRDRGEQPCEACVEADRAYHRQRHQQQKGAAA